MYKAIHVNYAYSNLGIIIRKWFEEIGDVFAADFETAAIYTQKEKEILAYRLDHRVLSDEERRVMLQQYKANGLSHPSMTTITHLSIADSEDNAKVIICDNEGVKKIVFNFLTTTPKKQIWHNCAFDFKHILYHTGKIPKNYVDTLLISRTLLNDAEGVKNDVGLKSLMGYAYGSWAIAKDNFTLEEMWDENMLKYAATDACATYKLYQEIIQEVG